METNSLFFPLKKKMNELKTHLSISVTFDFFMHGKCILAPKAPVFLQCDTQFLLLDFIGVICGFRCYSVHELSTD